MEKRLKVLAVLGPPTGARAICCAHKLLAAVASRHHHSQGDEVGGGGARGCIMVATTRYVLLVVFGYLWRDAWCATFFHVIFNLNKIIVIITKKQKMAFRIYNIDKLQLNGRGPNLSQAEM